MSLSRVLATICTFLCPHLACATMNATTQLVSAVQSGTFSHLGIFRSEFSHSIVAGRTYSNQDSPSFVFDYALGNLVRTHVGIDYTLSHSSLLSINELISYPDQLLRVGLEVGFRNPVFDAGNHPGPQLTTFRHACMTLSGCTGNILLTSSRSLQQGRAVNSPNLRLANSIPISAALTIDEHPKATAVLQWDLVGTATATSSYYSKSPKQYLLEAISAVSFPGQRVDPVAVAGHLQALRKRDPVTSSQNTNLRDAEYFSLGYIGGQTFWNGAPDLVHGLLALGPLALAPWKTYSAIEGALLPGNLPGTSLDDKSLVANTSGWADAWLGRTLEDAVSRIDQPVALPVSPGTGTSQDPYKPILLNRVSDDNYSTVTSTFSINPAGAFGLAAQLQIGAESQSQTEVFVEASRSEITKITTSGVQIAAIYIHDEQSDLPLQLEANDTSVLHTGAGWIDLTELFSASVVSVEIKAADDAGGSLLAPIGLRLATKDAVLVAVSQITFTSQVPELPVALYLLLGGVYMLTSRQASFRRVSHSAA